MSLDENKAIARRYMQAFQDQDYAWLDAHIAPEFVRHDRGLDFEVRGPEGVRKLGAVLHAAFSEVENAVDETLAEGDRVLVRLRFKGRHTGEYDGVAPTGRQVDAEVMDLFRVRDGRLVEHWALMDNLAMLKQVGAVDG